MLNGFKGFWVEEADGKKYRKKVPELIPIVITLKNGWNGGTRISYQVPLKTVKRSVGPRPTFPIDEYILYCKQSQTDEVKRCLGLPAANIGELLRGLDGQHTAIGFTVSSLGERQRGPFLASLPLSPRSLAIFPGASIIYPEVPTSQCHPAHHQPQCVPYVAIL